MSNNAFRDSLKCDVEPLSQSTLDRFSNPDKGIDDGGRELGDEAEGARESGNKPGPTESSGQTTSQETSTASVESGSQASPGESAGASAGMGM